MIVSSEIFALSLENATVEVISLIRISNLDASI